MKKIYLHFFSLDAVFSVVSGLIAALEWRSEGRKVYQRSVLFFSFDGMAFAIARDSSSAAQPRR